MRKHRLVEPQVALKPLAPCFRRYELFCASAANRKPMPLNDPRRCFVVTEFQQRLIILNGAPLHEARSNVHTNRIVKIDRHVRPVI